MKVNISNLTTEQRNHKSIHSDQLSTSEIIALMNEEDRKVADAVQKVLPEIEAAIEAIYHSLKNNGRLFYVGAGTSGRIGIVDASECPPTFCTPPELIQGIMAGGESAMFQAIEGAEDSLENGEKDLADRGLTSSDVVVGIAASGRTPYVIGALKYAKTKGTVTIALSNNENSEIGKIADYNIEAIVGPEFLSGSTRLKSATAQKMILNMFTTTTMIKLGKVYGNLMVDLNASNEKLIERARHIVSDITGVSYEESAKVLSETGQRVKPAIVMISAEVPLEIANEAIEQANGFTRKAIELAKKREL
jgi:N-acetylmuramic acid 6-phosphate etherase